MKIKIARFDQRPFGGMCFLDVRLPHEGEGWSYRILYVFCAKGGPDIQNSLSVLYQEIQPNGGVFRILKRQEFTFPTYWEDENYDENKGGVFRKVKRQERIYPTYWEGDNDAC